MSNSVCRLRFDISSYWRIGSGKGSDAIADALILRDHNGLPLIPGKTIKGLLRDAMSLAAISNTVSQKNIVKWFGSVLAGSEAYDNKADDQEKQLEEGRFASEEGCLWFGSAKLPEDWHRWASLAPEEEKLDVLAALTTFQSSTAVQRDGIVKEHSLRVAEVAVPMVLTAEVRGPEDDKAWIDDLKVSLPVLRALGSRRSRGLGRVQVTLEVSQ